MRRATERRRSRWLAGSAVRRTAGAVLALGALAVAAGGAAETEDCAAFAALTDEPLFCGVVAEPDPIPEGRRCAELSHRMTWWKLKLDAESAGRPVAALELANQASFLHSSLISPVLGTPKDFGLDLLDRAEEALHKAVADSPDDDLHLLALVLFYETWIERTGWDAGPEEVRQGIRDRATTYARQLLALARERGVSDEIWPAVEERTGFSARAAVLALWLSEDPRNPHLLAALGQELEDPGARAALFRVALDSPELTTTEPEMAAWLLQERLRALFQVGMVERALGDLERAPAPVRELVLAGASGTVELTTGSLRTEGTHEDLRLELAAAHAVAGHDRQAVEVLATLPPADRFPPTRRFTHDPAVREPLRAWVDRSLVQRLVAAGADGPDVDPFDLLITFLGLRELHLPESVLWLEVGARIAEGAGYPQIARELRTRSCGRLRRDPGPELRRLDLFGGLPGAAATERAALAAEVDDQLARLATVVESLAPEEPWLRPASCSPPPGTAPFRELPAGIEVVRIPGEFSIYSSLSGRPVGPTIRIGPDPVPPDLTTTALSHIDTVELAGRAVLVGLTWPVPPRGGLGERETGYWASLSEDGGARWRGLHATGLWVRRPFEVIVGSELNRWTEDGIEIEVGLAEDGARIGLPDLPAGSRALLRLDPSTIFADRDGDGLSDLDEEWIGTEPELPDSDGDTIGDGTDLMPRSGDGPTSGAVPEEAFATALRRILFPHGDTPLPPFQDDSISLNRLPQPSPQPPTEPAPRNLGPEETVFLAAVGAPLDRFETPLRVSVLDVPPAFVHDAVEIRVFELDRERRNALVVWSRGTESEWGPIGGRFLMTLRDGGWAVPVEVRGGRCQVERKLEER